MRFADEELELLRHGLLQSGLATPELLAKLDELARENAAAEHYAARRAAEAAEHYAALDERVEKYCAEVAKQRAAAERGAQHLEDLAVALEAAGVKVARHLRRPGTNVPHPRGGHLSAAGARVDSSLRSDKYEVLYRSTPGVSERRTSRFATAQRTVEALRAEARRGKP